ncbi:MAG TPA: DciA family protein [Acidiferrobacterales bacterium]|jgi:hypothetical protein
MSRSRPLGSYFSAEALARLGMPRDLAELPAVCAAWDAAAGEALAAHVRPIRFHAGVLTLRADGAVWASRLRHQQSSLLAQLRASPALRGVERLSIGVAPVERPGRAARRARARLPSERSRVLLETTATHIGDPDLKAALQRLARDRKREA